METSAEDDRLLIKYRNDLIYKNQRAALLAMAMVITVLVFVMREAVPAVNLYAWSGVLALSYVARYLIVLAYTNAGEEKQSSIVWQQRFSISVLISGLIWGSAVIFIFPKYSIIHQTLMLVIVSVLCVATTVSHSAYKWAAQIFITTSLVPIIIKLLVQADLADTTIGVILLLLYLVLLATAKNLHSATVQLFELNTRNRTLVGQLEKRNRELDEARNVAVEASRAKSLFLANMSHEIRTPLSGVLSMVKVLERTQLDQVQNNYLQLIDRSGQSLLHLLDELLDLSRIEDGRFDVLDAGFETKRWIEDVQLVAESMFRKSNVNFRVEIDNSLPCCLYGDSAHLHQVVVNLLSNSAKYTESGEVVLSVGGEMSNRVHYRLAIQVQDSGIGIDEDKLDTIFDEFYQVSPAADTVRGVGLGLAICKRLIDAMGGEISVSSTKGEGSQFLIVITLPVVDSIGGLPEQSDVISDKLPPLTVLVIDDDNISRIANRVLFSEKGHHVLLAENGREGVEVVENNDVDVVLMDVNMPVMDGVEATHRIRSMEDARKRQLPIIGMTASVMSDERKRYLDAGMDSVVAKPVDYRALSKTILKLMEQSKDISR